MQDVERFMKHYFLIAKEVGDLTAILCAKLEDQQAKPAPALTRMMAKLRPEMHRRRLPDSDATSSSTTTASTLLRPTCSRKTRSI